MQRAEFELLMAPGTLGLIAEVAAAETKTDVLTQVSALRKQGMSAQLVAAIMNQARLRRRAEAKFPGFADQMLFTEAGLEQATRLPVAAIHAQRFRSAGITSVADLGCGIGADAMAFAALGLEVTAVEKDEVTAAIASYNLASFENVTVVHSDVLDFNLGNFEALWLDPARRDLTGPRKLTHQRLGPVDFSPDLNFVFQAAGEKPTGVKLAPGMDHGLIPENAEAQWVSHNGDLVELTLWFGKLSNGPLRSALMLKDQMAKVFTGIEAQASIAKPGNYIYEPDPSLIRSHLLGDFANQNNLSLLSDGIAYLTSEKRLENSWLRAFELIDVLPLDTKQVKKYLAERSIGIIEVKKRGVDVIPEELRKSLGLKGTGAATLILTKVGDARKTLVVKPIR